MTASPVLWSFSHGPDVPTPVTDGTYLYVGTNGGIFWCLDAKTGRQIYPRQRLKPGTYSGSPVLADGRVCLTNEDGITVALKTGPAFEVVAENDLDDYTLSSAAISGGQIFIRTNAYLWAIGRRH